MNKHIIIIIILAVIIITLAGILFWPTHKEVIVKQQPLADIEIFSPKPNDMISSPLAITGIVRGNGWSGFEGQVGSVHLLDSSGKELAATYLPATTEWTTLPTNFEANVEFTAPSGTSGSLVFKNENASGDPIRDKTFTLPIKFK